MFDLASHKGYGTKKHFEILSKYGATSIHRRTFKPVYNSVYNSFKSYESLNITKYTISLIKKGFYIESFQIKEDWAFINYQIDELNVYAVSLKKNKINSLVPGIILKIKEKDSVNKVRLDVIYSDDNYTNPKVMYSCEVF